MILLDGRILPDRVWTLHGSWIPWFGATELPTFVKARSRPRSSTTQRKVPSEQIATQEQLMAVALSQPNSLEQELNTWAPSGQVLKLNKFDNLGNSL